MRETTVTIYFPQMERCSFTDSQISKPLVATVPVVQVWDVPHCMGEEEEEEENYKMPEYKN